MHLWLGYYTKLILLIIWDTVYIYEREKGLDVKIVNILKILETVSQIFQIVSGF